MQVDVVVAGFGAAGAAAALAAQQAGAEVLILEKTPEAQSGGSTRVSGNVWFCPSDPDQAVGYLEELCGERRIDPALARAWAEAVAGNTDFVRSLGVEIGLLDRPFEFPELPSHGCDSGYHHVMPDWGMGRLHGALKAAAKARQLRVLYETPAERLLTDESGAVTGVVVVQGGRRMEIFTKGGVVLATGGFANAPALTQAHLRLPAALPWGSAASTGDGLLMAQKVGAGLSNMENHAVMMGLAAPGFPNGFNVVFPAHGWILVDRSGRRFIDETAHNKHGKIRDGEGYKLSPGQPCFAIFDEATRRAGPLSPSIDQQGHGWNQRTGAYAWSPDNGAEIEAGWIARGATPQALGAALGIDGEQLARTVTGYNAGCGAHRDEAQGRSAETLTALGPGPFYGFATGQMVIYTCGGPSKDGQARVLDPFGEPIEGLFAAGEVASTYSRCMAGGQMIGDALAFGRIAGRSAAARAKA